MEKQKNQRQIGLFGGTFNPIHWGHLRAAEEVREYFKLDQVIFIPTYLPSHKEGKEIISAFHRLKMVKLAIKGNPHFLVSDFELTRSEKSYSVETINHFRQELGEELNLFFILGMDAFLEIDTWKDYPKLFSLCNFVVITRPGYDQKEIEKIIPLKMTQDFHYGPNNRQYIHISGHSLYFCQITSLDISSTLIREKIREGRSIKYLLPREVEEYLKLNQLYREEN